MSLTISSLTDDAALEFDARLLPKFGRAMDERRRMATSTSSRGSGGRKRRENLRGRESGRRSICYVLRVSLCALQVRACTLRSSSNVAVTANESSEAVSMTTALWCDPGTSTGACLSGTL